MKLNGLQRRNMKEYLIRITDEQNLLYDSEDRLYRYRMHCPYCGKESGCRCFETLEKAEDFMYNGTYFACSSKCVLMSYFDEQDLNDIKDTMKEIGKGKYNLLDSWYVKIYKNYIKYFISMWWLKWYVLKYTGRISEKDAYKVLDVMDLDYDSVEGESC